MRTKGNLGILTRYLADPCLPSWQILAETAGLAGLHAFLTFFQPNTKGTFKEAVGVSWLHKVKQGVLEAIPEDEGVVEIGTRFAFSFIELAEKGGFFIFVADLAGETLYNWGSMVLANTQCNHDPRVQRWHSTDPFLPLNIDGRWQSRPEWSNNTFYPFGDFDMALTIPPGGHGTIAAAVQFNGVSSTTLPVACHIIDEDTGQIFDAFTAAGAVKQNNDNVGITWAKVQNPGPTYRRITVEYQSLEPRNDITSARKGHCSKSLFTP